MKVAFRHFNKKYLNLIRTIGLEADKRGIKAYLVGGFVRDVLLGVGILDIDLVVEGDAIIFSRYLSQKQRITSRSHGRFGTATLCLPDGLRVDLATARKEHYLEPGALPAVTPSSIYDDLFRRDFTINAMAVSINPSTFAELVDYFGGYDDLRKKKIRILHEKSFLDDPTRILRAIRFEQRFHFSLGAYTDSLLKEALAKKYFQTVKPPRYFHEFQKILQEEKPIPCLKRLDRLMGFGFLSSSFNLTHRLLKLFESTEKNIRWYRRRIIYQKPFKHWLAYFLVVCHGISSHAVSRFQERFHLKKEEFKSILLSQKHREHLRGLSRQNISPHEIYELLKLLPHENIIFLNVCASNPRPHRRIEHFLFKYQTTTLFLNGHALKEFGLTSGKQIGQILKSILHRKIDGLIKTKKDEMRFARELIKGKKYGKD